MKKKTGLLICVSALVLSLGVTLGIEAAKSNAEQAEAIEAAGKVTLLTEIPIGNYAKIYRFTAPAAQSWGNTVYVHAWGSSDSSNNTTWPGINISGEYSFNESDRKVYTFATNVTDYQYLIFHNNNKWQTDNITIGNNTAWYLDDGNTPGTWTPENQTYYLYDYKGMFGGNAKCYAWQSNGSLENAAYAGPTMEKVQYGSGHLYRISLDPAFDMVKFGIGDTANTGDQWCNQHRGETFCWWDVGDSSWSNDLNWIRAHDWIYQSMHVRDIETEDVSDTGACRGSGGYYQKAKTAYQSFSNAIKTKISQDECFGIATTRFSAWAKANGETATFDGINLTINGNAIRSIVTTSVGDDNTAVVVIVTFVAVGAIASYFFIGKKKKQ